MRQFVRLAGLAICLLVLLTTCSPLGRDARISPFVTSPTAAPGPTVQPTVTPGPGDPAAPKPAPEIGAAGPPLSGMMSPASTGEVPPALAERAAEMDRYLATLTQQGSFSGSVLVAYQGRVLLSQGYGLANREEGIPAGGRTRYRLASVTKPLTALGVLRLHAAGRLDIDSPVCDYLESCPPAWGPIHVADLLGQSSGLPNFTDFGDFPALEQQPATVDQLIARFRDLPLGFTPGALYQYTNSNYVVLAKVIERVAGESYETYMRRELFEPLGMADTGLDPGDFSPLGGTRGYSGGALDIPLDVSNLYGSGDLYSTVEDLFRLAQALDAGRVLPADVATRMEMPHSGRYALGWMIDQRGPHRLVYHPGSMSGAATWFGRYPEAGVTVIVLSNNYYTNVFAVADYLSGLVLPQ